MYFKIPINIFDLELNSTELLILIGLLSYGLESYPSQKTLAKRLNINRATVNRNIKSLIKKNIIVKKFNSHKIIYKFNEDMINKIEEIKKEHKNKMIIKNGENLCKYFSLILDLAGMPKMLGYTKKDIKMASNLVNKCKTNGIDIKELIEKIVLNWSYLRENIRDFKGQVVLKENPTIGEICYMNEAIFEALNKISQSTMKVYKSWDEVPDNLKTDINKKIFEKRKELTVC